MSENTASLGEDVLLKITTGQSETDFDPERDWPMLTKIVKNFSYEQVWEEITHLNDQYSSQETGMNPDDKNKLFRKTFIKKWNLLSLVIRKGDIGPLSESFHQQGFVASIAKEFGGKRISSCIISSTLNALVGLGFVLVDQPKLEKEILKHLSGLYQKGEISYSDTILDLGVGTAMEIVNYLRANSELHLSAVAKSDHLASEGIMEGLLGGSAFVYAAGGHARSIVGITEERENIKLLVVDPLSQKPQIKAYSIEEIVNGGGDLPPISLPGSEFIRISRTDRNAVDMDASMRLIEEELPPA